MHDAVGGRENAVSVVRHGDLANVLVNNFSENQHIVWRAVALINNGSNFLEAGWVLDVTIFGNQSIHPYKTWVNLGVPNEVILGATFAQNTTHEFKVHDQNFDNQWSFAYDGTAMGNEFLAMDWGLPVSEAERRCTDDSLKADFKGLKKINCQNCAWANYVNVSQYVDTEGQYEFCRRSNTRYEVLLNC